MTTPLAQHIVGELADRGVPLVRLGGFRHTRPTPLSRLKDFDEQIEQILAEEIPCPPSGYHHSSEERSVDLQAQGFLVLSECPPRDFDFDLFYDLFLQMSLDMSDETLQVNDCTLIQQLEQVQPSSSAGLLPLNSLHGVCVWVQRR
jgi:hypothetical protein